MNKTILKLASGTAFLVSMIFTIMLMASGVVGIFPTILVILIAIILELSKCGLFYLSIHGMINGKQINGVIRIISFIISVILFLSSITASLSFLQNNNNKRKNITIESSQEYTAKDSNIIAQNNLIKTKQEEIEALKEQQKNIIPAAEKESERLRQLDRVTEAKNYMIAERNRLDKINTQISTATKELEEMTTKLINENNTEVKGGNETQGYAAFLLVVTKWLNEAPERKNSPVSQEEVEMWFFGGLGVIFEIVAVLLFYLSSLYEEKKNIKVNEDTKNEKKQDKKDNNITEIGKVKEINSKKNDGITAKSNTGITLKKNNINDLPKENMQIGKVDLTKNDENKDEQKIEEKKIGFNTNKPILKNKKNFITIDGVTQENINLYIKTGFENSKEFEGKIIFPGYSKISSKSGLEQKICRAINTVFSEKGITEVIDTTLGRRTIINFTEKQLNGDD